MRSDHDTEAGPGTLPEPDPNEYAARIRACRAFADVGQGELAKLLDISITTYKRLERGTRCPTVEEQVAIAEHCGVPLWFLQLGFRGGEDDADRAQLLKELLQSLGHVRDLGEAIVTAVGEFEMPTHVRAPTRRNPRPARRR